MTPHTSPQVTRPSSEPATLWPSCARSRTYRPPGYGHINRLFRPAPAPPRPGPSQGTLLPPIRSRQPPGGGGRGRHREAEGGRKAWRGDPQMLGAKTLPAAANRSTTHASHGMADHVTELVKVTKLRGGGVVRLRSEGTKNLKHLLGSAYTYIRTTWLFQTIDLSGEFESSCLQCPCQR